jgi:hypothetical protein
MPASALARIRREVQELGDPRTATFLQRFFKTGRGEYAEGDRFLREHYRFMPRTMLRYAIERFSDRRRQQYLRGDV